MIYRSALLATLFLAACQTTTTPVTTKPATPQPVVPCQAANYQTLIGQHKSKIRAAKIPGIVRIIHSDSAVTLDYNENRLNIQVGPKGTILKVTCG